MGNPLSFLIEPYASAWRRRAVLRELSVREVQGAFTGSMLGLGWVVIQPLASLTVYALVFGGILNLMGAGRDMAFVSRLFAGLILFHAFSEAVSRAPRLVLARPNYVTKVVFPLDLLPWPPVVLAALHAAVSLVLLVLLHTLFVGPPAWTVVLLPFVLAPVLLFGLGCSWVLASLGVYVRDTHEVVRVVVQLLFFVCPIVWVREDIGNELLRTVLMGNPIAVAIEAARACLTGSAGPGWLAITVCVALTVLLAAVGHAFFRRTQDGFADVL